MLKEFKDFITRGNVVDLAVAVVIGAAFTGVVNSFAKDVLMQFIAAIFGTPDFAKVSVQVNATEIYYGAFINALISKRPRSPRSSCSPRSATHCAPRTPEPATARLS